jgi:hypothetical protein
MKIIWTDATEAEAKADYKEVLTAHKQAMKEELTWDCFGGVITVNGHKYQVVDK